MFRKISRCFGAVIILAVLLSCASSKPIDSNLGESGISARFRLLADILRTYQTAHRHGVRNIRVPEITAPVGVEKDWKFSDWKDRRKTGIIDPRNNTFVEVPEKLEFRPRKFRCNQIEDVFIPAVDKKVPAYICKLFDRQFVLSSERFLEDFKDHLEVVVDETTFRRLAVTDDTYLGNTVADVVPVTLTQRQGDEFYGVKKGQN